MDTHHNQLLDPRPSIPPPKRKQSSSLKRPTPDNSNLNLLILSSNSNNDQIQTQPDINIKQYRILSHCFNNNLMQYYNKKHKNLLGELEQLYKVPINRDQRLVMETDVEGLVERNWWKLARDVYARNGCIAKQIQQYSENYQKYSRPQSNNDLSLSMTQNIKTIETPDQLNTNHQPQINNSLIIPSRHQKSRPHSSTKQPSSSYTPSYNNNNYNNNSTRYSLHYDKQQRIPNVKYNQMFRNRFERVDGKNQYFTQATIENQNMNGNQIENEEAGMQECFVFVRENCRKNKDNTNNNNIDQGNNFGNSNSNGQKRYHKHTKNYSEGYFTQLYLQPYKISDQNNLYDSNNNNNNKTNTCTTTNTTSQTPINRNNNNNNNNYYKHHQYQYQYVKTTNNNSQQYSRQKSGSRINGNKMYTNYTNNSSNSYNYNNYNSYNQSEQKYQVKTTNINKFFNSSNNNHYLTQDWNIRNKLVDELERQKIQNKILSMNSTSFSANYSKPQGYKAKSKCWGGAIVSSGKIGKQGPSICYKDKDNWEQNNNNMSNKLLFSMPRYK